ncbi:ketopantoate reductase family protein [Chloroflexota bacterium]
MSKKLAVLGVGAIGSSIGADLTRAGHDILLIDQWPAHVEAMKAQGLRVTISNEEIHTTVKAVHLCELRSLQPQFDIVFLASKSYDSRWMAELIKPYLKSDGVVITTQNSFNDEWVSPIVGNDRDIGCMIELSAEVFEPGMVRRNTDHAHTNFVLGELDGRITARVQEVSQILSAAGNVEVSTNIWGVKWGKFVLNSMTGGLQCIAGITTSEGLQNPEYLGLSVKLGSETTRVGLALGYKLEIFGITPEEFANSTDESMKRILQKLASDVGKKARSAARQDLLKGRPNEIAEYLNGLLVKKGKEAKIPTPYNEAIVFLIKQMEQGKLEPELSNLAILEQQASQTVES